MHIFPSLGIELVPEPIAYFFTRCTPIYELLEDFSWTDPVTGKTISEKKGFRFDMSTGGSNVVSRGPIVHDIVTGCERTGYKGRWAWDDGTPITTAESKRILDTIMGQDGQRLRQRAFWNPAVSIGGPRSPHG